MSTAMGHLLSSSNMIEDYHQSQQDKVQHKRMKALSKETIDLEIFKMGLHGLGKTVNNRHAYLSLAVSTKNLFSLVGIQNYQYLQNVDVSNNNLITLKPLGALKHLLMLNASSNKIKKLFDFEQPANLQYANYARNEIKQIEGTDKHKYLRILVLDGNQIERIEGLDTNFCLRILSLNQNKISEIQNINHLDLEELYLSENSIKQINGLNGIKPLFHIDLSRNQITHLKGLEVVQKIRFLYLHGNNIAKIKELQYIEQLPLISNLDLCFNPIQTKKYYRLQTIFHIPQLRWLDGVDVTPQQKVKAQALHGMDVTDRQATFKQFLPDEKFTDRRVNIIEEVDPESDDEVEQNLSSDRVVDFNDEVVPRSVAASRQEVSSMTSSIYRQRSTQSAGGGIFGKRQLSLKGIQGAVAQQQQQQQHGYGRNSQASSARRQAVTAGPLLLNQSRKYVGELFNSGGNTSADKMFSSQESAIAPQQTQGTQEM